MFLLVVCLSNLLSSETTQRSFLSVSSYFSSLSEDDPSPSTLFTERSFCNKMNQIGFYAIKNSIKKAQKMAPRMRHWCNVLLRMTMTRQWTAPWSHFSIPTVKLIVIVLVSLALSLPPSRSHRFLPPLRPRSVLFVNLRSAFIFAVFTCNCRILDQPMLWIIWRCT